MIGKWLKRGAGTAELEVRVAALERDLSASQTMLKMLADRATTAERIALDAVRTLAVAERRLAVLRRAMRGGGTHLRKAIDATRDSESRDRQQAIEMERLKASLAILDARIEADAEEARRSALGLFQRVETLRSHRQTDG